MKLEKTVTGIWAFALAGMLSVSVVLCMVTAFHMQVDVAAAVLSCIVGAAVCSVCFTLPLKLVPPGLGALALGYLWQSGALEESVEALLNRLTRQYDRAYSWGIIRWGFRTADEMEPTMVVILCVLGAAIAMAVSWSVCKGKPALPGILLSALCVATCFVVTDTVPDTVWLYFLLLCVMTLLLTGAVRRQDAARGNRLSLYLVPVTALALLVLLAAVPKQSYHGQANAQRLVDMVLDFDPLQLLRGELTNGVLGDGDSVDLTDVGYRQESDTEVLSVTAEFNGTVYLRGRTMNTYNGKVWYEGEGTSWTLLDWPSTGLVSGGVLTVTTRYAHQMQYVPYYIHFSQMRDLETGKVNTTQMTEYSYTCQRVSEAYLAALYGTDPELWSPVPEEWSPALMAQFITLPDSVKKWAEPLAKEITGDVTNVYLRAQAIGEYVRNSAVYDTNVSAMPGNQQDFVRWFLEDSDRGYCVHFASAAAVLLQASDIPARYVTGYTATAQAGQTVAVQAKQAHAWVEYWLPGFGWTILEATPPDLRGQEQSETTQPVSLPETQLPAQTQPVEQDAPGQDQSRGGNAVLAVLLWLAVGLLAVGAAVGQRRLRLWLGQRSLHGKTTNAQTLIRWQEVTRLARLTGQVPDEELFRLAQKAKYSQHIITEEELARFDENRTNAIELLKKRSVFHRFWYCFVLAVY